MSERKKDCLETWLYAALILALPLGWLAFLATCMWYATKVLEAMAKAPPT